MPHLSSNPVHLGLGALVVPQPEFTGDPSWYEGYGIRTSGDGKDGRLVSMHTFTESWTTWEMHPVGEELVLCTSGSITLVQELDGEHVRGTISAGEYAINPAGVWHTAEVDSPATAVFITAGLGTEMRPV